jgi:hypothetical protein
MSPYPNDRRVWTRYTANRRTVDLAEGDTEEISWVARVQDISRSGVGLVFRRPFELGARLTVEFLVAGRDNPIQLQVEVVHAKPMPTGDWYLGCELDQELNEAELQDLLKPVGQ